MKKTFFFFLLLGFTSKIFCQIGQPSKLSISIPTLFNTTEIKNLIGPQRTIQDNGIGFGVNITYSKTIFKSFFLSGGIGYFAQRFNIHRPFDYNDLLTNLLYTTNFYKYNCIQLSIGGGYEYKVSDHFYLRGAISYNPLYTTSQKYKPETSAPAQVNREHYFFGNLLLGEVGGYIDFNTNYSLGLNTLLPLVSRWKKDKIFRENTDEYYHPKNSLGLSLIFSRKF